MAAVLQLVGGRVGCTATGRSVVGFLSCLHVKVSTGEQAQVYSMWHRSAVGVESAYTGILCFTVADDTSDRQKPKPLAVISSQP